MTTVTSRGQTLDPGTVDAVLALADAVAEADGDPAFDEHALLHVRHGGDPPVVHLLARDADGALVGYGHLDVEETQCTGQLAVHPGARRRGVGRMLLAELTTAAAAAGRGPLRVWAHGDHPAAAALAAAAGFRRTRVLLRMHRPLSDPLPEPQLPAGVRLRAYQPGADDEAWLAVNARAFADHPEQGRWTTDDLRRRLAEPWFDAAGFLLAERPDGSLAGFHWTKIHPRVPGLSEHPMGEIYVLGVDPAAHGTGLGTALALAGLRHLQHRGVSAVILYVEEDNHRAVGLYRRLGFTRWSADVVYTLEHPGPG